MKDEDYKKISEGICISERGVDHCPNCTDSCDAFHHKHNIKELSEPVNTSMSEKEEPSEAWKAWERENKHHTSGINPHAFILGYKAAKSEPAVSQGQEPVFTKSRVFALLQEIEDDIDEQAEEGSLDRRQVKQRINNYFKEMFKPID